MGELRAPRPRLDAAWNFIVMVMVMVCLLWWASDGRVEFAVRFVFATEVPVGFEYSSVGLEGSFGFGAWGIGRRRVWS